MSDYRKTCIAMNRDVNDALKKHLLFYEVIWLRKTEYRVNPQMTRTKLVPPNKTKSTTNGMHRKRSDFLKLLLQKRFSREHLIAQITFKKNAYYLSRITSNVYSQIKFTSCWTRKWNVYKIRWHLRRSDACNKKNETQVNKT